MLNILRFYGKPFVVISLVQVFFYCTTGTYFEAYEGFFSSLIQGGFSEPLSEWWAVSTHFLLMAFYNKTALLFPGYNIYGIVLVIYNYLGLTLLGLAVYRIQRVNAGNKNLLLFVFIYCIISMDNFINLNTSRQAFILIATIFLYIESRRLESRLFKKREWVIIACYILFCSLIRMVSVLLFSLIYIVLLMIKKRFYRMALLPVAISGIVFLTYNVIVVYTFTEAKQVYIFKEKEIYDRDNVDYSKLTPIEELELKALKEYGIADREHFKFSFYKLISLNNAKEGVLGLLGGFNIHSFVNTIRYSFYEFDSSKFYIIFFIVSGFILLDDERMKNKRDIVCFVFILLVPFLLCFITLVPVRFLVPYFAVLCTVNLLVSLKRNIPERKLTLLVIAFTAVFFVNNLRLYTRYVKDDKKYKELNTKLFLLETNVHTKEPIIINNFFQQNFFPVSPFGRFKKHHALFLNVSFFSAEECQLKSWQQVCHCNSLSLKEKIDYIVSNQNLFLIDDESFAFLHNYLDVKYHVNLVKTNVKDFDANLKVCKLSYVLK